MTTSLRNLPVSTRVAYTASQLFAHCLLPVVIVLLFMRAVKEFGHLKNLSHRLGFGPIGQKGSIWIYAASLGETRAASPLVRRLIAEGHPVLLTHLSPAGYAEGWRLFPDDALVTHRYMPVDLFWAVRIFLWRARPVLGVVLEIEIWPSMMIEAARANVPLVMANGNLLDESIRKMVGFRSHIKNLYHLFDRIFTRNEEYRNRYVSIGVQPDRVEIVGELKYDQWIDSSQIQLASSIRSGWAGAKRVLMIASSTTQEEDILMRMIVEMLGADKDLRILWAPRSPQRFDAVAKAAVGAGLSVMRRSSLAGGEDSFDAQVLIGDSIGEMNAFYPVADLVFVGASLVDMGGHNIMEPMALGRPVVMGPSIFGIAFAAKAAAAVGAFESLPDARALRDRIIVLLADGDVLCAKGQAALAFAQSQRGAADAIVASLKTGFSLPWGKNP